MEVGNDGRQAPARGRERSGSFVRSDYERALRGSGDMVVGKRGYPARGPKWTNITVAMRADLKAEVCAEAKREGCSPSIWMRRAARVALARSRRVNSQPSRE